MYQIVVVESGAKSCDDVDSKLKVNEGIGPKEQWRVDHTKPQTKGNRHHAVQDESCRTEKQKKQRKTTHRLECDAGMYEKSGT
jgi:hypothetical protein